MYEEVMNVLTFLVLVVIINATALEELVVRSTSFGDVSGYSVPLNPSIETDSRLLDVFVGIPYAVPPVGELRWQLPQSPPPWNETLAATSFSPCCSQDIQYIQEWSFGEGYNNTDEDCLYLNIYSPRNDDVDEPVPGTYPVMVWIHGGSNRYGCGEEYDSRILPTYDVIVVTINYRLGILGYLSTDDDVAPGNYGLHDQVLTLQWVQQNIGAFGGDPAQVTIFGNSAGGANVALQMFSPLTDGLFHRVIEQSGTATAPWALYRPPLSSRPSTVYLAEEFGCSTMTSQAMVDCLRLQDADDLVYTYVPSPSDAHSAWAPRVDGHFLLDTPEHLLSSGEFARVALLSGTVPDEVAAEYPDAADGWSRDRKESEMFARSRRYDAAADRVYDAMLQQYDLPGDVMQQQRDLFLQLRTENEYIAGHDLHVQGHSQYVTSSYLYSFEHRAANHTLPDWMGVPHFEECCYVFGAPLWLNASECPWGCLNIKWADWADWTAVDVTVAQRVMQAWTNFAKTGNPSIPDCQFPEFNVTSHVYTELTNECTAKSYYRYSGNTFNNIYLPKLLNETECYV